MTTIQTERPRIPRAALTRTSAARLARVPFDTVTLEDLAADADLSVAAFRAEFVDVHAVGAAVLDHERAAMHAVQRQVAARSTDPLDRLVDTYASVGALLADDVVVRAGVRLAAEARHAFPERRLDPFATWEAFVTAALTAAQRSGALRPDVDVPAVVRMVVAAGMGTKDHLASHDAWADGERLMRSVAETVVTLLSARPSDPPKDRRTAPPTDRPTDPPTDRPMSPAADGAAA